MVKCRKKSFSERFVACDLKLGRYRQLIELMKFCECKSSRSFLDLGQRPFTHYNLLLIFLETAWLIKAKLYVEHPYDGGEKSL